MESSITQGGQATPSTRPYLIRALHEWCTDNGFTPYIAVQVDRTVQVPMEFVSKNEIVLNVGFDATSNLDLGNEFIQFKARFGGTAREIIVPIDHVVAIYARENGQGMAFPAPDAQPVATQPGFTPTIAAGIAPALAAVSPGSGAPMSASEARPMTPLRSLRLAPDPAVEDASTQIDVPSVNANTTEVEGSDGPEPDSSSGGSSPGPGRPTLKRIK
jgi:stringent starvation protein B